jgi:EF-hand domain pair/EF hand
MISGTGPLSNIGRPDMKHAGIIAGIVLAATSIVATGALAKGQGHGPQVTFQELDADNNGEISKEEMQAHRQARFATADTNGDGKLSLEEMQGKAQERAKSRADKMMERFDANNDGFLSEDEMPKPRKAGKYFDRMDADDNGSISEEEFAEAKTHMQKRGQWGKGKGCDNKN